MIFTSLAATAKVRNLIERNGSPLTYLQLTGRASESGEAVGASGTVVFDKDRATKGEIAFYQNSRRLRRDINAFNATGGGVFRIRRGDSASIPFCRRLSDFFRAADMIMISSTHFRCARLLEKPFFTVV